MKGEVQLYIGGAPVELTQDIDILWTYSVDELTNPTIVKNSFSKTITIEDSPENSKLFGQFWNVERIQTIDGEYGTSFNPSKRVPFVIYVNGDIYQEGYAKLLSVDTIGKNNKYSLSLFGGLGSFFYNLSYEGDNEGDNKKKLSDLHFMTGSSTPSEREFDFVIKKETLQDAWDNVTAGTSSMWHYINFADCYDGYPSDFDADKVLVNLGETASTSTSSDGPPARRPGGRTTASAFINTTATTDGTYASYDGYVLAELPKERTAAEMREFRSYLMRPVVRVKEIINACCAEENNGGYEVQLDDKFFNSDNPYWEKAWMTLPLLTDMDFNGNEGDDQTGVTVTLGSTGSGGTRTGDIYTETTAINLGTISANTSFNIAFDLDVFAIMNSLPTGYKTSDQTWLKDHSVTGGMYMEPCGIYPCAYSTISGTYYPGTICIQLVAYSRDGKVVGGSEVFNCTSGYHAVRTSTGGRGGATQVTTYVPTPNDFSAFTPGYETTYTTKSGEFRPVNGSSTNWKMKDKLSFVLKKLPKTCTLKLIVSKVNQANVNGNRAMNMYQRYYTNYTTKQEGGETYLNSAYSTAYRLPATINHFEYELSNIMVSLNEGDEAIRTGSKFGKADLLNTDYTPAEFFLSYCKLFGLYIEKDKYENIIYVRTRDTFYRKENIIDISDKIDRSKTSNLTPLVFDAKWYNWKLDNVDGLFSEQYTSTYGQPYGIQRVNTGYNFDASEKDLYKGNVFKSAVECLEKSDMFGYVTGSTQVLVDAAWKPWMFDGYSYNLYNVNDMSDTVEMEMPVMVKKGSIISYSKNKYYDLYTKLQFHGDDNSAAEGANVLVFYNGSVPTKTVNTDQELNYWITDDNAYMMTLNDNNPCWLYTTTATDKGGSNIAIKVDKVPHFTRYITSQNSGDIKESWDFGYVKQLFMPDYNLDYARTLYMNYWQSYIRDMYDIDSKKLSCYVKFDNRPFMEWLRDFYWFDNSVWRIQKIEDFNVVTQDSAKVEFIKVQDVNNYSNVDVSAIAGLHISASTSTLTQSGGSVTIYVTTTDDWYVSDYTYTSYNASASSGHGNGSFTVQISANKNNYNVVHHINVLGGDGQSAWCQIVQEYANLTVVKEFGPYTNSDIPWTGGTQMYDVFSTYPWTVTNVDNRDYVTLTPVSGTGGTLANHFECTFAASDSLAPRNVCMRFTDTQGNYVDVWKWQEACGGLVYQYTGGTKVVQYVAGASAVTPDWLSVVDNGDGTYNVTAIENPDMSARTVNISFSAPGEETKVIQVIQEAGIIFDVVRTDGTGSVLATGATIELSITSNVSWSSTTYSNWSVPQTTAGTTSATINVVVSPNDGEARKGTIAFNHTGGIFYYTVSQNGINTDNFVDPTALVFDASGGTQTFNINTTSDVWRIVGKPSWVSVSSTAGTGSATISVTVPESNDWERSGSIVVYNSSTTKTYVVSVQQATGDVWKVARVNGSGDIPATGGLCYLEVTSPNHSWTATTNDTFISVTPTAYTASTGVYVMFDENLSSNRTATITFDNGVSTPIIYSQTQAGNNASGGWVNPGYLDFNASGGTANTQTVTANTDSSWQVVARPNWVTITPTTATGVTTVSIVANPYSGTEARSGTIVFYDTVTRGTALVIVNQEAPTGELLAVSPSELRFTASGGEANITIIANTDWTIA